MNEVLRVFLVRLSGILYSRSVHHDETLLYIFDDTRTNEQGIKRRNMIVTKVTNLVKRRNQKKFGT